MSLTCWLRSDWSFWLTQIWSAHTARVVSERRTRRRASAMLDVRCRTKSSSSVIVSVTLGSPQT